MHFATRFFVCSFLALLPIGRLAAQNPLVPTGTLRAAFLGDNPSLGRVNAQTGAVTGPIADFVKELSRRLGVPYKLIPVPNAREVTAHLLDHSADVGFMAYNAGRAADVDFTAPWLLMPNTYLVRADSPILNVADADRAGVRILAAKNDTQDVYLSAHLKNTSVTQIPKVPEAEEARSLLLDGKADALAANRQRLFEIAADNPKLRVVADDYFVAGQAIAVPKGDPARIETLNRILNEILASDLVKAAIDRAGLRGVNAAKPKGL